MCRSCVWWRQDRSWHLHLNILAANLILLVELCKLARLRMAHHCDVNEPCLTWLYFWLDSTPNKQLEGPRKGLTWVEHQVCSQCAASWHAFVAFNCCHIGCKLCAANPKIQSQVIMKSCRSSGFWCLLCHWEAGPTNCCDLKQSVETRLEEVRLHWFCGWRKSGQKSRETMIETSKCIISHTHIHTHICTHAACNRSSLRINGELRAANCKVQSDSGLEQVMMQKLHVLRSCSKTLL